MISSSTPRGSLTAIGYLNAIVDDQQRWVSVAEVAEIGFTAFTGRHEAKHITARLIVWRVNPSKVGAGQSERFAAYRYHAVLLLVRWILIRVVTAVAVGPGSGAHLGSRDRWSGAVGSVLSAGSVPVTIAVAPPGRPARLRPRSR